MTNNPLEKDVLRLQKQVQEAKARIDTLLKNWENLSDRERYVEVASISGQALSK
ncbi:MAG: hypothetical protein ISR95_08660 [Candidatus Marinimicrobia bacterium]|nr:hypothetical protein [Candidatus Brocadiales bacterium]MBL7047679.1 hypothetical protein [Candidatus Neomarinimicrobiota bacterium]